MNYTKNPSERPLTYLLSKDPKNWFVSFDDLKNMIGFHELSPLAAIAMTYMDKIRNVKISSTVGLPGDHARKLQTEVNVTMLPRMDFNSTVCTFKNETFGERYYLPYPWVQCFAGSIASFADDANATELWVREESEDVTDETELPLTKFWGYTFRNYFQSRLSNLLTSSISPEQYKKWKEDMNYHVILNSERRSFVVVKGDFAVTSFTRTEFPDDGYEFELLNETIGYDDRVFVIGDIDYAPIASNAYEFSKDILKLSDLKLINPSEYIIEMLKKGAKAIDFGELQQILSCQTESIDTDIIDERIREQLSGNYQRFIKPFPWVEY